MSLHDSRAIYRAIQEFKAHHPVRSEVVGSRDLEISKYYRDHNRPSKKGLIVDGLELGALNVSDLDMVAYDYRNRMMRLFEFKTRGATYKFPQSELWTLLDSMMRVGAEHMADHGLVPVRYGGLSVVRLQNTSPANSSWIKWDEQNITREECWRRLNMLDMLEGAA